MKVWIIGAPGSGKSALGAQLGASFGVPHYQLDDYYWLPGWQSRPTEEFKRLVDRLVRQRAWVIDGNYSETQAQQAANADLLLWLSPPVRISYFRIFIRSWRRALDKMKICNGNTETFGRIFSRDGMIFYTLANRRKILKKNQMIWHQFSGKKVQLTNSDTGFQDAIRGQTPGGNA